MSSKKIIVVTGATGAQGGSVARFLLNDGTYAVRAVTRNPDSPAAKELAAKGAEVIKADMRVLASLEKAFAGAYGVFGVTNFWEPGVGYEGEVSQGKSLVDAAKATGIKHFVWSTLDSTPAEASHWESKNVVDQYLKKSGVPRTSLYTSFYFENYLGLLPFLKRNDGSYDFPLPLITDAPFAVYSVAETGAFALAAFLHPETWLEKDIRITTDFLSAREMAKLVSDVSGKTIHVSEIDASTYGTLKGNSLPDEIHSKFVALFAQPARDPALARKLYPSMKTSREWVQDNIAQLLPE
ncbi:NmrA-like family domain-containing protein 1 [Gautieria morchelliformis]|nr:NmrA-like family domain-containing protein 1 [Gautieria morchelliformis]